MTCACAGGRARAQGKDALGQQYLTPSRVIGTNGSDVIIVGRARSGTHQPSECAVASQPVDSTTQLRPRLASPQGVIGASDVAAAAQQYREAGWAAYTAALSA